MSGGGKGGGSVTTGFRYYFGILMGLSRGPVNGIEEIKVGDKRAWIGKSGNQSFNLIPDLRKESPRIRYLWTARNRYAMEKTSTPLGSITSAAIDKDANGSLDAVTLGVPTPITVAGTPAGTMTVSADGSFTYIPHPDYYGPQPVLVYQVERDGEALPTRYYAIGGALVDGQTIGIEAYDLFGGEEKEGGVQGTFQVKMGSATQTMAGSLYASMRQGDLPGLRGVVTAFFDGIVCMVNPYPKPWQFRLWRTTAGWQNNAPWYAAKATVPIPTEGGADFPVIRAMNPAHIIYECYTNKDWGRGLDVNSIDEASFIQAADQLHTEGFGLCLRWNRKDSVQNFIKDVIEHIGASVFASRRTGLVTIRLIRGGYNLNSLPLFTTDSGIVEINSSDVGAEAGSVNMVSVKYRDQVTNEDRTVSVGNAAARIAAKGVINAITKDFQGICVSSLARRVAQRELRMMSMSVRRFELTMDRRAYFIEPGSVIAVEDPRRGIPRMAVRVANVDISNYREGRVRVSGVQDVFSLPQTSFSASATPSWTPPNTKPCVGRQRVVEAPYFMLVSAMSAADLDYLSEDAAKIATFNSAGQPLNTAYYIAVRDSAPTSDDAPISNEYICS